MRDWGKTIRRPDISKGLGSKEWPQVIAWLGGAVVNDAGYPPDRRTILTTNCSAQKADIREGTPHELYVGNPQQRLHAFCVERAQHYGILSDHYGLVYHDQVIQNYDVAPSNVADEELWRMGQIIREKCEARGFDYLHYVASSPVMACPYFIMLAASGIPFAYSTRLRASKTTREARTMR